MSTSKDRIVSARVRRANSTCRCDPDQSGKSNFRKDDNAPEIIQ